MLKNFVKNFKKFHDPLYTAMHPEVMGKHCAATFFCEIINYMFLFVVFGFICYLGMAFLPGLI